MFSKTIQRDCLRSILAGVVSRAEKLKTEANKGIPIAVDIIGLTVMVSMETREVDDSWTDPKHEAIRVTAAVYVFETVRWKLEFVSALTMQLIITTDDMDQMERDFALIKLTLAE